MIDLLDLLDKALPDSQVVSDISRILWRESNGLVELEEGDLSVPQSVPIEIVTKAFFKEYYDISFGNCFRTQVAIGGIEYQDSGVLFAKFCFATLYYKEKGALITIDFHKSMR
jgi:hypothetical protein